MESVQVQLSVLFSPPTMQREPFDAPAWRSARDCLAAPSSGQSRRSSLGEPTPAECSWRKCVKYLLAPRAFLMWTYGQFSVTSELFTAPFLEVAVVTNSYVRRVFIPTLKHLFALNTLFFFKLNAVNFSTINHLHLMIIIIIIMYIYVHNDDHLCT